MRLAQLQICEAVAPGFAELYQLLQSWVAAQQRNLVAQSRVLANTIDELLRGLHRHLLRPSHAPDYLVYWC